MVALHGVDWHQLGTQLGVPQEELERIDEECHNVSRKLNKMLDYWLKNNEEPSWEKIVKALERIGHHGNLVTDLRCKYCSTPLKTPTSSSATVMNVNGKPSKDSHAKVIAPCFLSLLSPHFCIQCLKFEKFITTLLCLLDFIIIMPIWLIPRLCEWQLWMHACKALLRLPCLD